MLKAIFLCCLSFVVYLDSPAQNTNKIQRAYAFYKVIMPGNIPVDENGKPLNSVENMERFIYIELTGSERPAIISVLYNEVAFGAVVTAVNGFAIHAGKKAENGQDIQLTPKKGNRFWKVDLQLPNNAVMPKRDCRLIVIKGKAGYRPYKFYLYRETGLSAPDMY